MFKSKAEQRIKSLVMQNNQALQRVINLEQTYPRPGREERRRAKADLLQALADHSKAITDKKKLIKQLISIRFMNSLGGRKD